MLKQIKETITREVIEEVTVDQTLTCDICGKEIADKEEYCSVTIDLTDTCYYLDDECYSIKDVCKDCLHHVLDSYISEAFLHTSGSPLSRNGATIEFEHRLFNKKEN